MWMALRVHSFTGLIGPTPLKGDREMNVSPMCTGTICLGVLKTDPGSWQGTFFGSSCFHPKKRNGSVEHGIGWNFQITRERPSLDDVYVYTFTNLSRQYMWTHTCAYTHTYLHSQINMDTYMHINKKYGYSGKPIEGPSSQQIQTVCVGTLV